MLKKNRSKKEIPLHNIEEIDFWNFPTNKKPYNLKR